MRGIVGVAAHVMAVMVALAVWAPGGSEQTYAQAADPLEAVEALIAGANESLPSGDGTAFAAAFTEDGMFTNRDDGFAAVGRQALTAALSFEDPAFQATLTSSEVDGNTVTGSADIVDQDSLDAGVASHIELFTATVEDGLVSSFVLTYDHDDPDTVTYLEYLAGLDDGGEDDGPPPGFVDIELAGDQPGTATIAEDEGIAIIAIEIEPGEEGVVQPAHVHTGTCEEPGGIVYPLAYPIDGFSFTLLSTTQAALLSSDYIVNVHLSEAEPGTYVSCAALGAADDDGGGTTELPNTGTGVADDSSAMTWLIASLALVGIGGVAGATVVAARRR